MSVHATLAAAGLLIASIAPAFADSVTSKVVSWDPLTRTIVLEDQSQFSDVPGKFAVPDSLKPGASVTIEYEGSESGVDAITGVKVSQ